MTYTDSNCKVPNENPDYWWGESKLQKPVDECTTNVIGNTVKFSCKGNGHVVESVYHDVLNPEYGGTPGDCSTDVIYTLDMYQGCNNYDFGGLAMEWDNWCLAGK